MSKYIEIHMKDLSRFIKMIFLQLCLLVPLSAYYKTELSLASHLISEEFMRRNKLLSSAFDLSSGLVGDVADKFIVLVIIVSVILVFNSIYTAITFDSFIISIWHIFADVVIGILSVLFPIINNNINYDSQFVTLICLSIIIVVLLSFLFFRFIGFMADFLFFGKRLKAKRKEPDTFTDEDLDESDDEYEDYDEYGDTDESEEIEVNENIKPKVEIADEEFYETSDTYDTTGSNRVSIFKR